MAEEVRFTVSDETEVVLQKVIRKLNLSRNQTAHYCMSLGLSAVDAMLADVDMDKLAEKVAERLAPGMEKVVTGAMSVLLQPQNLQRFIDDAGVKPQ